MKNVYILFFAFSVTFLNAQSSKNVERGLFKLNALTPGASYELGIGKKTTLNFDLDLAFAITGGSGRSTEFGIFPSLNAEFRNYNNFKRRQAKGKNTSGNSGNFISFYNSIQSIKPLVGNLDTSFDARTYFTTGVLYGFQRTYTKGFYWNLSFGPGIFFQKQELIGPGVQVEEYYTDFGIVGSAKIGWVLGKKRTK